ncbi:hypothetical protein CPB83DRAFT_899611 [Crepidotus variabilis]|uniref:SET domain-containing protein n=1 Tax=Crepidotus variabilis TaxID=179855 RepID=A0A9P6E4S4_9AGAR|nr:hypothetical protein CPB83DRAFT_899611 [Crepidotus variabilis]
MDIETLATNLSCAKFDSRTVIFADSILTTALFGRHNHTREKRLHRAQVLATEFDLDEDEQRTIRETFESGKSKLTEAADDWEIYHSKATSLCNKLTRSSASLQNAGPQSRRFIAWWLEAYTLVINPNASVKLSTINISPDKVKGFAIHSTKFIPKDFTIKELVGLMPYDNNTAHTRLSEITPAPSQDQQLGQVRILFGPIRFINHLCVNFNTAYIDEPATSTFYVYAIRDIQPNEEITVDYGTGYFDDLPEGCPCRTCSKPPENLAKMNPDQSSRLETTAGTVGPSPQSTETENKNHRRNKLRREKRKEKV